MKYYGSRQSTGFPISFGLGRDKERAKSEAQHEIICTENGY